VRDQLAHDGFELGIDIDIGKDNFLRQSGVDSGKGIECLTQHAERGFGNMADAGPVLRRHLARLADTADALGDFLGLVARPFKVGDDLGNAEHQAQVGSCRLAPGDQVRAVVIDSLLDVVDHAVGLDDLLDAAYLTGTVGSNGGGYLGFDQAAHLQHGGTQVVEVALKLAGKMLSFVHFAAPVSPCGR
jgi:hypothetical protein